MKAFKMLAFVVIICTYLLEASLSQNKTPEAETIYPFYIVNMPADWYAIQVKLWEQKLSEDASNLYYLYNYYLALWNTMPPFGNNPDSPKRMEEFLSRMERKYSDSYLYFYAKHINSHEFRDKDVSLLERAYKLNPNHPEILKELIEYYELFGSARDANPLYVKLYESGRIPRGLLEYAYNTLMSTEENAVLFTGGIIDSYSCLLLQRAKGIRTDVTVMHPNWIRATGHLKRILGEKQITIDIKKLPEAGIEDVSLGVCLIDDFIPALARLIEANNPAIPVYFAMSMSSRYWPSREDMYRTGLASRYSRKKIDAIGLLIKNVERRFRLDYLQYDWYSEREMARINWIKANYVNVFLIMCDYFKRTGNHEKSDIYKSHITELIKDLPQMKKNIEKIMSTQ